MHNIIFLDFHFTQLLQPQWYINNGGRATAGADYGDVAGAGDLAADDGLYPDCDCAVAAAQCAGHADRPAQPGVDRPGDAADVFRDGAGAGAD